MLVHRSSVSLLVPRITTKRPKPQTRPCNSSHLVPPHRLEGDLGRMRVETPAGQTERSQGARNLSLAPADLPSPFIPSGLLRRCEPPEEIWGAGEGPHPPLHAGPGAVHEAARPHRHHQPAERAGAGGAAARLSGTGHPTCLSAACQHLAAAAGPIYSVFIGAVEPVLAWRRQHSLGFHPGGQRACTAARGSAAEMVGVVVVDCPPPAQLHAFWGAPCRSVWFWGDKGLERARAEPLSCTSPAAGGCAGLVAMGRAWEGPQGARGCSLLPSCPPWQQEILQFPQITSALPAPRYLPCPSSPCRPI